MEIDGSLAVKVEAENGQACAGVSSGRLRELVRRIGGVDDHLLVLQRIPDLPHVFAQVWHEQGGEYELEHRRGEDELLGTRLTDPARVADLLIGWARQEDGWDAGVIWEPVDLGPAEEVPELPDAVRERLEPRVRVWVHGGYGTREELAEAAEDHLVDGDDRPVSRAQARRLVDRLWLERVAEQAAWEGATDPDRLTRAFEALDAAGITAREDFTCCRGCGLSEIGAERAGARGFVFFHRQGTESAAEGHGLSLYYGGFDGSEATTAAVGQEVVAALTAAGLSAVWDGNPGKAIEVTPLTWHKRLVG
ncbi:hypothetical protein ABZ848_47540 [Streptomyces sp. NPDC047081]|uniref:DUF6891 domain-containing protein n=1 Tax=Streptomyces sp. NPDC047081 TaxID=3154706 RepID=UPI0033D975E5